MAMLIIGRIIGELYLRCSVIVAANKLLANLEHAINNSTRSLYSLLF